MPEIGTYDDWCKERVAKLEVLSDQIEKRMTIDREAHEKRMTIDREAHEKRMAFLERLYVSIDRKLWAVILLGVGAIVVPIFMR